MGYSIRHDSKTMAGLTAAEALETARGLIAQGALKVSLYDGDGDPISLRALDRVVHAVDVCAAGYGRCDNGALSFANFSR